MNTRRRKREDKAGGVDRQADRKSDTTKSSVWRAAGVIGRHATARTRFGVATKTKTLFIQKTEFDVLGMMCFLIKCRDFREFLICLQTTQRKIKNIDFSKNGQKVVEKTRRCLQLFFFEKTNFSICVFF